MVLRKSINAVLLFVAFAHTIADNLPAGQHLASTLRDNKTYVDKTGYFLKILNSTDSLIFCARPPGFGKSFFVDMLQLICMGNESRELFKGTEIYESDYTWPKRTVLYFNFDNSEYEQFESALQREIIDMEHARHIRPRISGGLVHELCNLVQQMFLAKHEDEEIVVLIDNYDAPIVKCLPNDVDGAMRNFDILRQFFGGLQTLDVYIRLAFITGVSKFPMKKAGLEMDIFMDVTLYENYTAAMAFTEDEVNKFYQRFYVNATAEESQLRDESFGYRFSTSNRTLYHPHSVARFFERGNATEVPEPAEYVLNAFKERPHFLFTMQNITDADLVLSHVRTMTSSVDILPMLFQTGHLTIKKCNVEVKKRRTCYNFDLGFATPRIEEYFLNTILEDVLVRGNVTVEQRFSEIRKPVMNHTLKEFLPILNAHLKRVSYGGRDDKVYSNLVECLLRMAGFSATWKQRLGQASLQQIDCIFELLVDRDADDALQTMVSEDHKLSITDSRFRGGVVLGLNFDTRTSTINGCEAVWFDEQNNKTDYHYFHKLAWNRPIPAGVE